MKLEGEITLDVVDKAYLLIHVFTDGLARGYRHYNKAGQLLLTTKAILVALRDEGEVIVESPCGGEG